MSLTEWEGFFGWDFLLGIGTFFLSMFSVRCPECRTFTIWQLARLVDHKRFDPGFIQACPHCGYTALDVVELDDAVVEAESDHGCITDLAQFAEAVSQDTTGGLRVSASLRVWREALDTILKFAFAAAANPKTPKELLPELAESDWYAVRVQVAQRTDTQPGVLERLADDSMACVRLRIARNPSAPPEAITALVNDDDPRIQDMVTKRLSVEPTG